MRISLIALSSNEVNIFPLLSKALSKKVSGLELSERFVPVLEDVPIVALEEAESCDFVIVFALLEEDTEVDFLKHELVEVELKTNTRILKFVSSDGLPSADQEEYEDAKKALVEQITSLAVNILFNEKSFEPKDRNFF